MNANDIIGRQFKLKSDLNGFIGYPGSTNLFQWSANYITPPVYSWVKEDDGLYWLFWSEIPGDPTYYLKNQESKLELLPGGTSFTPPGAGSSPFDTQVLPDLFNTGNKIIKYAAIVAGIYFAIKALK